MIIGQTEIKVTSLEGDISNYIETKRIMGGEGGNK